MMSVSRLIQLAAAPLAVAVAFAAIAETASAQPPQRGQRQGFQRGGAGFGGFGGGAMLVANPQVQEELDLTDEQKEKVREVLAAQRERAREGFGGFRDLTEEQRAERLREARERQEALQKQIDEVLTADQKERLQQIQWQQQGLRGLATDDELAAKVGLSDDERSQIRDVLRVDRERGAERPTREQLQEQRAQQETAVKNLLGNERWDAYQNLLGERVEIRFGGFGGRGEGGQRPGGGQRPQRRGQQQ